MVLHAFNSGVQNPAFSQNLKMMGHAGLRACPDQGGTICLAQNIQTLDNIQTHGISQSPKDRNQIELFQIGRIMARHTASYPFLEELTQHFYSSIVIEL